ncbi:helix-turn-helix domain-containing protein [Kribbella sp. NPDC023855]|uniref:helix-turn-helix domain-containing protein n=1 Tax=Kribbella sp. NPDC023855 TaxID=3154698 RepID=UPI0033F60D96
MTALDRTTRRTFSTEQGSSERMSTTEAIVANKLLLTVEEAAKRLGIGRTTCYGLVMSGEIESVPVGRLRRVPVECLDDYVKRLLELTRANASAA